MPNFRDIPKQIVFYGENPSIFQLENFKFNFSQGTFGSVFQKVGIIPWVWMFHVMDFKDGTPEIFVDYRA